MNTNPTPYGEAARRVQSREADSHHALFARLAGDAEPAEEAPEADPSAGPAARMRQLTDEGRMDRMDRQEGD